MDRDGNTYYESAKRAMCRQYLRGMEPLCFVVRIVATPVGVRGRNAR